MHMVTVLLVILVLLWPAMPAVANGEQPEERVLIYDSYGYRKGDRWTIPLRFWVHEDPDLVRNAVVAGLRSRLAGIAEIDELTDTQRAIFAERAYGFIADSESREIVEVQFDDDPLETVHRLLDANGNSRTDRNGLIKGVLELSLGTAERLLSAQASVDGWLTMTVVSNDHHGTGKIRLVEEFGLSVISDIDDTIKVTEIPAGRARVIDHTFFSAYTPSPCMPQMYRSFPEDTSFHYVSGSPWQLYEPLAEFVGDADVGYPAGSFHMKNVRTNLTEAESYGDIWKLVAGGSKQATLEQKLSQIGDIIERFPARQFVLIGDSGEKDPEIFAAVRDRFGKQMWKFVFATSSMIVSTTRGV